MDEIIRLALLPMSVLVTVCGFVNLWLIRQNRRHLRQWVALNDMLLHLCVGAFLLRHWPMVRHIIEIERGEPEPAPRRFWQRRPPERTP